MTDKPDVRAGTTGLVVRGRDAMTDLESAIARAEATYEAEALGRGSLLALLLRTAAWAVVGIAVTGTVMFVLVPGFREALLSWLAQNPITGPLAGAALGALYGLGESLRKLRLNALGKEIERARELLERLRTQMPGEAG